jgi:hypothetical protein
MYRRKEGRPITSFVILAMTAKSGMAMAFQALDMRGGDIYTPGALRRINVQA